MQRDRFQRSRRKHNCGHDIEVCSDKDKTWYPQRSICYAQMEEAAANWRYDEEFGERFHDGTFKKWSDTRSATHPYGHRDGVTIFVAETDLYPDDDWLPPAVRDSPI